jgi:twitching motility protein PilT
MNSGASDLHIIADSAPTIRIDGTLKAIDGAEGLSADACNQLISSFVGPQWYEHVMTTRKELDFAFSYQNRRFRVNVFLQKGSLATAIRLLPSEIRALDTLGLPAAASQLVTPNQGLVIVAGPTGHGKSSTLAAMVNHLAQERQGHIITIEDPIEYVFTHKRSIIAQREVGNDTPSFNSALRTSLREDPDIVLIGEIRDLESIEAALTIAQTGHLVLTTLHTNSAAQTANRIIDVFPPHQQPQIRVMLAEVLVGILSQRLLPKIKGGRALACELLLMNPAVRAMIREGKTHQIPNLIQTSAAEGMVSLDSSLAKLVTAGEISLEEALAWSLDPRALKLLVY